MLLFSISFPDLIKFSYFVVDTLERRVWGERRPKDKGDFRSNFSIYTYMPQDIYNVHM